MVTVDVANPGELVDWAALLEPHCHQLTALCLQKATILVFDARQLRALLETDDHTCAAVMKGLVRSAAAQLNDTCLELISERSSYFGNTPATSVYARSGGGS